MHNPAMQRTMGARVLLRVGGASTFASWRRSLVSPSPLIATVSPAPPPSIVEASRSMQRGRFAHLVLCEASVFRPRRGAEGAWARQLSQRGVVANQALQGTMGERVWCGLRGCCLVAFCGFVSSAHRP